MGNWQAYAAVTGSAMAMVTNASASTIGNGLPGISPDPIASARTNKEILAARDAVFMQRFLVASAGKTVPASQTQAPSISPGGIVPLDGSEGIIQPGEWVSIFGSNLASGTTMSNGDFPTSLGGTSVEIDGKPAFLLFVSPGQINLQAPDDSARGKVSVVVTTASGSATSSVTLSEFAPSFVLLGGKYVSGIILRPNHSGGFGGGTYDILGPSGSSFGYPTVAAQAGDTVELYAVGLGPTTPPAQAGKPLSGAAPISNLIDLYINKILVRPSFVGLSSAGLYQINLTVPSGLGTGNVPISAVIGGLQTQAGVLFSLRSGSYPGGTGVGTVGTGGIGPGLGFGSTSGGGGGGGTGGGGSGGSGGGSGGGSVRPVHNPYQPKLRFVGPKRDAPAVDTIQEK